MGIRFSSVGELREAMEGLPDETQLWTQVVAEDGCVWQLWPEFIREVPGSNPNMSAIILTHPELKTLPKP